MFGDSKNAKLFYLANNGWIVGEKVLCVFFASLRLCVRFFCFFCKDFTLKRLTFVLIAEYYFSDSRTGENSSLNVSEFTVCEVS